MTDDLILSALTRLETKLDEVRDQLGATRESMSALRARSEDVQRRVSTIAHALEDGERRITRLEGFRSWILGAVAAGSVTGAVISALISWAVGGQG